MKTPLRYQATGFDCGATSFVNALMYLCERAEIPPAAVRYIMSVCGDKNIGLGLPCQGTSGPALAFLASWLNNIATPSGMPVRCEAIAGADVSMRPGAALERCIATGGVAVLGCNIGEDHYVLLTGADDTHVRLFDPYYETTPMRGLNDVIVRGVTMVDDAPFSHNRIVERDILEEPRGVAYSLDAKSGRDAVLFWRV